MADGGCVVSNSSPLIALDRIGRLHLMRSLLGEVVVPPAVVQEVFGDGEPPAWLRVVAPKALLTDASSPTLGRGERNSIVRVAGLTTDRRRPTASTLPGPD